MWIYLGLFLLPAAWWMVRASAPRLERPFLIILLLALTLFIGTRWQVGGDWDSYIVMIEEAPRISWLAALWNDPGYLALELAAGQFGAAMWAVNIPCALIFVTGLILFCRLQPFPPAALAISIPVLITIVAIGSTRQATAIGFLMIAYYLLSGGRGRWAALMAILACTFHWSAVLFLPLAGLLWLRSNPGFVVSVAAGLTCGIGMELAYWLIPQVTAAIGEIPGAGGALFRVAFTLPAFVLLALRRRIRLPVEPLERRLLDYMSAIAVFAIIVAPVMSTAADRIGYYLIPYQIMVYTRAIGLVPPGFRRGAAQALIVSPYLIMFLGWINYTRYHVCWAPYRSYLDGSAPLFPDTPEIFRESRECDELQGKFLELYEPEPANDPVANGSIPAPG